MTPATQADSSVLQLFSNLAAGLLFFSLGFHRQVIRIFAESMRKHPPGSFALGISSGEYLIQLGADMFSIAVRLAIPVVALLMLLDLSLALLSRINSQMQLLTLAFPTKMLVSMGLLTVLCAVMPRLYRTLGDSAFDRRSPGRCSFLPEVTDGRQRTKNRTTHRTENPEGP